MSNLALACPQCNLFKGSDIATLDRATGKLFRLFHPRVQKWDEHFQWNGPHLTGKTPVGRCTTELLRINNEARVIHRSQLMLNGEFFTGNDNG